MMRRTDSGLSDQKSDSTNPADCGTMEEIGFRLLYVSIHRGWLWRYDVTAK